MSDNFDRAIAIVLHEEGGLSDNPADPGGLTNFGISQRAYPKLDIRALTEADARAIYARDYWPLAHGDFLPWPICLFVFDHCVNAGRASALKILQHGLGVAADGAWGPSTAGALAALGPAKLDALAEDYVVGRVHYYLSLSTAGTFGDGWCGRVARVALKGGRGH